MSSDPIHAWRLTLLLIEAAPTLEALSYVAAGPLEDLLYGRGEQFIDEVERLARQIPNSVVPYEARLTNQSRRVTFTTVSLKLQLELLTSGSNDHGVASSVSQGEGG